MAEATPLNLSPSAALRHIRDVATETSNIVIVRHASKRQVERGITRRQIELCVQKGTITEGPFMNAHGNWQVTLFRHATGEQINCVVAIDWPRKLIVVTAY
ncbi:DUF4258 domain-containing protein [Hoeflea sp. G2-23]|uniref:DUF4258 domain-containing protein n=1 Tax=Hoeflea algicola TaxID=2983763 RepID=A0ABT3ZFH2_9HYPH|nr:DUF4258 domain-containing protein [Hoeflea algicola]MCY0149976.1 DUF4258 domain-containing protein [Hoeflea algicola]